MIKIHWEDNMDKSSHLTKHHLLWIMITQIEHIVGQSFSQELRKIGLTREKWAVIHELVYLGGESTPYRLSKRFVYEPHSISALLSRMEREGFILKTKDLAKKNMVRVSLTDKSRELYPKAIKICQELFKDIMGDIPEGDGIGLLESISRLRDYSIVSAAKRKNLTPFKYE